MQGDKFVPMSNILHVHVHRKYWMSCGWGLSDSKTWWNRDTTRVKGCASIIIRTGSVLLKGFSPNSGSPETVKEVADLLKKLVSGGPGMIQYIGF